MRKTEIKMAKKLSDILQGGMAWSRAHYNTYRIVTGKTTFEKLCKESEVVLIICKPKQLKTPLVTHILIEYYEDKEEYEKCIELKETLNER